MVQLAMIEGNHRWQVDDTNLTTLPILYTSIVPSQQDYKLPSGFLRVERVQIRDNQGNRHVLKQIDQRDINGPYYNSTDATEGIPTHYDLIGDSILLFPVPDNANFGPTSMHIVDSLTIHILREIDIFTTADDTQELGFPEPFHRIVTFGAAYDYLISRGDYDKATSYRNEAEALLEKLRNFSTSMGDEHIRIRPSHRTSNYL
jgi:hypothetical protein